MHVFFLLASCLAAVRALPATQERIIGGAVVNISQYPYVTSMLYSWNLIAYNQVCAGTIISTSAILSAAHCYHGHAVNRWRARIGSAYANSGGTVHTLRAVTLHPNFNVSTFDNDIAVLRTSSNIVYVVGVVASAPIPSAAYNLADNQAVFAAGWGSTYVGGPPSEQLRHVQFWTINQNVCAQRYNQTGLAITNNMVCAGWLNVGGLDQCQGDNGGPLVHNGVVVGVSSWGLTCNSPIWPRVNTKVSRYTTWIQGVAA